MSLDPTLEPPIPTISTLFQLISEPTQSTPAPQKVSSVDHKLALPLEFPSQVDQVKLFQTTTRDWNKGKRESSKV